MLKISVLKKYQEDYKKLLMKEFNNIIHAYNYKETNIFIFKKYLSLNSLAGMDVWISNFYEKNFLLDIKNEIIKSKTDSDIFEIKRNIQFSIKNFFRDEDYRFSKLEQENLEKKDLLKNVNHLINESNKNLNTLNKFYIPIQYTNYYHKTTGSPSKLGLETKLIKIKLPKQKKNQVHLAEEELKNNWINGYNLYKTLTKKINIISSPGLVSYSLFNEFGISYINVMDRDLFETVDDLIHENSHHHLNIILKKYKLLKNIETNISFYSPWRRELRSPYAIMHSVFTFTFGALLFENILIKPSNFMKLHLERVIYRFLEETYMIKYSLEDLNSFNINFYQKGKMILEYLNSQNIRHLAKAEKLRKLIKSQTYKKRLSELEKNLKIARKTYS